jgi:hypothetical protein
MSSSGISPPARRCSTVGRRQRQREKAGADGERRMPEAPSSEYRDPEGNVLVFRGLLTPAARREYGDVLTGGIEREDAWQRAAELLFERLTVSWTIAGLEITRQKELVARYRISSQDERRFVRESLRGHVAEHFPELQAP